MIWLLFIIVALSFAGCALLLSDRRRREAPDAFRGVPHHDYGGPVLDPARTLLGRDLASAEVRVRSDDKAVLKLICEDGSSVEFGLEAIQS